MYPYYQIYLNKIIISDQKEKVKNQTRYYFLLNLTKQIDKKFQSKINNIKLNEDDKCT